MRHLERAFCWRRAAASCIIAAALPQAALAAETETAGVESRAVTLNEEGARYYAARDYRRAVEKFIQAYATDSDPNLLFNIASCYEGLGDVEAAVEKYREFLAAPGADPSGRSHAEAVIARWEQAPSGNTNAAPNSASPALQPPSPAPESPPAKVVVEAEDSSRWVPWVVLGGGGVIAALGGASYMLGANDHARVTDADGFDDPNAVSPMTRAEADELVDSGRVKKQIGAAGVAVGGAMVASCLLWWLLDDSDASEPVPAIAPTAASGAIVTWAGAF